MDASHRRTPVAPPAKTTNPGNEAAAKLWRACPRPSENEIQLLLVVLYMSTYDEGPLPDAKESLKHQLLHMRTSDISIKHQSSARKSSTNKNIIPNNKCSTQPESTQVAGTHLPRLQQRKPIQTPTTQQPSHLELARGLWDAWSSCCSSRCTCPRTMRSHCLMHMRQ